MGMTNMGLVRAEGDLINSVKSGDRVVIQRYTNYTQKGNYWEPFESTVDEFASYTNGGSNVLGIGQVTLVAGSATVSLPAITSGSKVFLTSNSASPNAVGAVVTAATGFVIHSASGSDTSVINYIVYS